MKRKALSYLLSATLVTTVGPTPIFANEDAKDYTMTCTDYGLNEANLTTSSGLAIVPYEGDGFQAEFNILSEWDNEFSGEITLTNTGNKTIENWTLVVNFEGEITTIWNGEILAHEGNRYMITNLGWNQNLGVGESITIGLNGTYQGETKAPLAYDLISEREAVYALDYTVDLNIVSNWGEAFTGEVIITNTGSMPIEDWTLDFDFDKEIESFWEADIIAHEGNHYVVKNKMYNGRINPGATLKLGFNASPGDSDMCLENISLSHVSSHIDPEQDTDSDGIVDWVECALGTSTQSSDTDEDSLSDYIELYVINTDPLKKDTDDNGISDWEEDSDQDGLTNSDEMRLGTKINGMDSDLDGVQDGDEVNIYNTNPLSEDTDGDTVTDFEEVTLGLDPLVVMTDGVTPDGKRTFYQSLSGTNFAEALVGDETAIIPSISGEVVGLIDKHLSADVSSIKEYDANPALLGRVIHIASNYDTFSAVLDYDIAQVVKAKGDIYADDLVICQIGGQDGLIPLETTYAKGHISASIQEAGDYLVLNTNDFLKHLGIDVLDQLDMQKTDALAHGVVSESVDQVLMQETDQLASEIMNQTANDVAELKEGQVILDDYQVIDVLDLRGDSDADGITNEAELGKLDQVSVAWAVEEVLESRAIDEACYEGDAAVMVYRYSTNPTLTDTDYDGIDDNSGLDLVQRTTNSQDANAFSGTMEGTAVDEFDVDFRVDYRLFFETDPAKYNKDLSQLATLYTNMIYGSKMTVNEGTTVSGSTQAIFKHFGLSDVKSHTVTGGDDVSQVIVGHRRVEYQGEIKEIIVADIRGTNSSIEEWSSNFDVGINNSNYWDRSNTLWTNKTNHKGFDVTANKIYQAIVSDVENYVDPDAQKVIFMMGHSRGAAIANILGAKFEDDTAYESYTYTFAAPHTTTSSTASSYKTIHNVMNTDDIIAQLPLDTWGFTKYGKVYPISVEEYYEDSSMLGDAEGTFEWLTGKDYNNDGGTERTLECFADVADTRAQLYQFDYSDDGLVNPHNKFFFKKSSANEELEVVNEELVEQRLAYHSKAYIDKGLMYEVVVRYKPAFLMQVLANMTCGVGPTLGYDVAGKYATAKASFVASSGKVVIGGLTDPHVVETYYLIVRNDFKSLS